MREFNVDTSELEEIEVTKMDFEIFFEDINKILRIEESTKKTERKNRSLDTI